jgi:hypothetical protein
LGLPAAGHIGGAQAALLERFEVVPRPRWLL